MSVNRKAWKLQDFVAHASNVTCLAVGPMSGRVMVTGGEDRKVNMWAVGQPNVIMSLSGHTTPIQCVKFNASEELVVAGSQSGSLKIWDLEAAKIVRTLTGHKSSVQCLDFHPYGDFVASGSLDTNVKLWDVRRKGCIFTYKGHTDAVRSLRFSPDGRWVISGGEDNSVKLWDLTAGRILNEFAGHTAAVNCIEFHPKEFLMASGSSDRVVKFWDLETFDLVASTPGEQSAVRSVKFHPEGSCLFSASQDSLRVYGWEPLKCYDSQTLGWGRVSDFAFSSEQLVGASYSQTNVSVWIVDLQYLKTVLESSQGDLLPNALPTKDQASSGQKEATATSKGTTKQSPARKSFSTTRPTTSSTKQRNPDTSATKTSESDEPGVNYEGVDYEGAFKPRQNLSRSPRMAKKNVEPFKAPQQSQADSVSAAKSSDDTTPAAVQSTARVTDHETNESAKPTTAPSGNNNNINNAEEAKRLAEEQQRQEQLRRQQELLSQQQEQQNQQLKQQQELILKLQQQQQQQQQVAPEPSQPVHNNYRQPSDIGGFNIAPKQHHNPSLMTEDDILAHLHKDHPSLCSVMDARLKNLSLVGRLWTDGEIKTAVETASVMPESAVLVDLLNVLILKQTLWNLDICVVVLPQLTLLLDSKHESYVETASQSLKLVLKNFAPVIKSNMAAPPASVGVDLVREERFEKCQQCHTHLLMIRDLVSKRTQLSGRAGNVYRQLAIGLNSID